MKTKTLVAIGSALLLVAGMFTIGAGVASATESNQTGYWQTLSGEQCFKDDSPTTPYILPAPPADRTYSKVIIKAGSTGHSVDNENTIYNSGLITGATFTHSSGKTISHVIVCTIPTPRTQVATAVISFTPPTCDTNQKLILGAVVNSTWGKVAYSGEGNRTFSVTATATVGHKFADGKTTKTFYGVLLAATGGCNVPPPCLPNSAVSYTYNATTNSGVITVKAMSGYSNELCKKFWVTAASWTFDGATQWPQTLDQWNPANGGNSIHKVGTYPYAATVTCGQGDIYATFNSPGVPQTTGVLTAPNTPYKEHFLHQMGFNGPSGPTWTVQNAASCQTTNITSVPKAQFEDKCGVANDKIIGGVDTSKIDYTIVDKRDHGVGTVTVTAVPKTGYTFAAGAYTGPWAHNFTNENCVNIKPIAPKVFDAACASDEGQNGSSSMGYIQLDLKDHLRYTIDGQPTSSARNFLGQGTYTVAVTADAGYKVDGAVSWTRTINPPLCDFPTFALLSTSASMSKILCATQGSYTLAATEGVQWFLNGSTTPTAAGTHKVSGASTVNVEAKLVDPVKDGWEGGARTAWTFKFADPTGCLPTLAFTGSNGNALGLLLVGVLLLFGGAAIAFERAFRFNAK